VESLCIVADTVVHSGGIMKESAKASVGLIKDWLQFQVYKKELPSMSVGIFVEDETVLLESFGYKNLQTKEKATPQTLYRIASHSKVFTATVIMKLFANGELRLDDRISDHLEWFRSENDPNMAYVTIRHLLSHSSGMNRDGLTAHWDNDTFPDKDQIKQQAEDGLSSFEVAEHWKYSNMGFTILGQVIESVTGKSYEEAVEEIVLKPMGLKDTHPDFDDTTLPLHATGYGRKFPGKSVEAFDHVHARVMNSATGFSSNVEDLIQFYRYHMPGNESYLSDRDKREMQRVQFQEKAYSWGLGWSVESVGNDRFVGHAGGYPGFLTNSFMVPESKIIIIVLTNSLDALPAEIGKGIYGVLSFARANNEEPGADKPEIEDDKQLCDEISGYYASRWAVTQFSQLNGKLVEIYPEALSPSTLASRYTYLGDNRFKQTHGGQNGGYGEVLEAVKNPETGEINLVMGENVLKPFRIPE
jgi:D-alanyl-D-alanine carboxypeptidase